MKDFIRKSVRALSGYTPGEQPRIAGLIKLNTNENPYPPSSRIADTLRGIEPAELRRYPDPVSMKLRLGIARLHRCRPEQVFVGNGSDEILALCTRAFVEDNGVIGYFEPSYSLYPVLAAIRNVSVRPVDLTDDFGWQMPARYRASLFFMTNPNAPTGIQYPRKKVGDFCRMFPGVVLIDEAYVDFAPYHCMQLALRLSNVLVLRTLSKSYSLAGLRLGYVIGSIELIAAMYKLKDSYNNDMVAQRVASAAIADQESMKCNVSRIIHSRDRLSNALTGLGCKVMPSATNFLWVCPPGITAANMFAGLRRRKILVRYFPGQRTGDYLRITVGTDVECDALITAMAAILTKKRGE